MAEHDTPTTTTPGAPPKTADPPERLSDAPLCDQAHAPYYVYILRCSDETLYTGIAADPARRLAAHNRGKGAKYTRTRLPVEPVYREACADKSAALRREWAIKKMTRSEKLLLIAGAAPDGTQPFHTKEPG